MLKSALSGSIAGFLMIFIGLGPAFGDAHAQKGHNGNQPGMNHSGMDHSKMDHSKMQRGRSMPTEPGQGAFATIAEIVMILQNDPDTDWSKVNINQLREHLIDMDELTLRAHATTKIVDDKVVFTITGKGRTLKAIHTMVPAHSGVLSRTTKWKIKAEKTPDGAIMTITTINPYERSKVKALGFFGVMATGAHHQAHHLAMARGEMHIHAHE